MSTRNRAVALLGRDDGARAQLRQSLEALGASIVFEGEAAGTAAGQLLERAPRVVIVNLADGGDDELDHLQQVFDAPEISVVFNESDVSSRLQGWDLARWARHLAAKVLGDGDTMPPPPPGAEQLPQHNLMPSPGAPPTPAQMAPQRAIEEFVLEAEDRVDALPEDFLPMAPVPPPSQQRTPLALEPEATLEVDAGALNDALLQREAAPEAEFEPSVLRVEREPETDELPDAIPLPDLGELDRALEAEAEAKTAAPARSDRELLDEALGGLDLDFVSTPPPSAEQTTPAESAAVAVPFGALYLEEESAAPSVEVAFGASDGLVAGDDNFTFDSSTAVTLETEAPSAADWNFADDADTIDDDAITAPAVGAADAAVEVEEIDFDEVGNAFGFTLDDIKAAANMPATPADVEADDEFDESIGSAGDDTPSAMSWSTDHSELQFDEDASLDADVAALAAQLDALEQTPTVHAAEPGLDDIGLDFDDAPEPVAERSPRPVAVQAATPGHDAAGRKAAPMDFSTLELTAFDAEIAPAPVVERRSEFDFSAIDNLSLEPLDDEEDTSGATLAAPAVDPLLVAMGLVDAPAQRTAAPAADAGGISRVIVLGASIGGPDALRSFLAGIPTGFPALFLLVQHLENGYFERLAQQLQKATKLPVRAAIADGPPARMGEVLVIPANARFTVDSDGTITAQAHAEPPHYSPSIDAVLRDAADRFGNKTTAIIFSGMAGDAIEGAVYVTAKGGEVWAQDPSSCVVSSMVDGARARGVVEFIGSPRELAERCVALYGV